LYFETLHSNLETIHGLDRGLSAIGIIKADKSETFALVGGSVNEYFGADDVSEGQEHLHELRIPKLLGKVIDKEITALGTGDGASNTRIRDGRVRLKSGTLASCQTLRCVGSGV